MSNNLNLKECRICFENNESQDNLFISPCLCDGTSKYVHSKCLEQWIKQQIIRYQKEMYGV